MYDQLISLENIFSGWNEFREGKQSKPDVLIFERFLEDNIFALHEELSAGAYRHGGYKTFHIQDPKPRTISKATVRDRLVHHLVFKQLYAVFDLDFFFHSYASREKKGTHLAVQNLSKCLRQASWNYTRPAYALKCDIRKFFDSIDHRKLLQLIERRISDKKTLRLIEEIVGSFFVSASKHPSGGGFKENFLEKRGVPIGNITSQIFANIYLNELDWFIKRELRVKNYFRYADDFVIVHQKTDYLKKILWRLDEFLKKELKLGLHPDKVFVRKFRQGTDFLGYVVLPHYTVLRTKTKRRMLSKIREKQFLLREDIISEEKFNQSAQSYLGMLTHCRGYRIKKQIGNIAGFEL